MIYALTYMALGITIVYHSIGIYRHVRWFRKHGWKP